jgi:hypothetical protein
MNLDRYFKPASALWRGRAYFAIGGVLWLIGQVYTPPYSQIPADQREFFQTLINKALGSLDKIGYVIMFAGLAYAVLTDMWEMIWVGRLAEELRDGFKSMGNTLAIGVLDITFEAILTWITNKRGNSDEYKSIARAVYILIMESIPNKKIIMLIS